ncbi:MAG: SsrA-binding protein [bacterium]|nr:SsrA-binding protein [bacterium]
MKNKLIATNPNLRDYKIYHTIEAGISLYGWETKSIRLWGINLKGAYIGFNKNGAFLLNAKIKPYPFAQIPESQKTRSRPLLLHKKEINFLYGRSSSKFLIIPTKVYWSSNKIKIEIGVAKRLKKWEKREKLKQKAVQADIQKEISTKPF